MPDPLTFTALQCIDATAPFRAHLSSVTYPAALAFAAYHWREGINALLKDLNRDF